MESSSEPESSSSKPAQSSSSITIGNDYPDVPANTGSNPYVDTSRPAVPQPNVSEGPNQTDKMKDALPTIIIISAAVVVVGFAAAFLIIKFKK